MSLVNQMLRDLEKRRAEERRGSGNVFSGLTTIEAPRRSRTPLLIAGSAVVALGGAVGYLLWERNVQASDSGAPNESRMAAVAALHSAVVAPSPAPAVIELPAPTSASPVTVAPVTTVREEKIALQAEPQTVVTTPPPPTRAAATGIAAEPMPSERAEAQAPRQRADATRERAIEKQSAPTIEAATPVAPVAAPVIEKTVIPLTPQQIAATAYQRGYEALRAKKQDEAEGHLREALRIDEKHVAARETLAGLLLSTGRRVEAAAVIEAGVKEQPEVASFRKLAARLALEQGDATGAIKTLEEGAATAGSDGEYHALLAALYQRANAFDKSVAAYQRALTANPGQGVWWLGLAISTERLGQADEASAAYKRALQTGIGEKLSAYARDRIAAIDKTP